MKILLASILTLLLVGGLSACSPKSNRPSNPSESTPPTPAPSEAIQSPMPTINADAAISVTSFTVDQLFEQGGGGCGMSLWQPEAGLRPAGLLFFNRAHQKESDAFTLMQINGEFVRFRRIGATGQAFYGQKTSQTFTSQDGKIQLQVNVQLGQPGEIESIAIAQGTIQITLNAKTLTIPVQGDAGC